jgi:hypothetical protein
MEQSKLTTILQLLVLTAAVTGINGMICDGLEGLCDLRIDQVTFPGAHNAGSDNAITSSTCLYRNHLSDMANQFCNGVRYFDIDTCLRDDKVINCHCGVFGCRHGTDMSITLSKLDAVVKCISPDYCNKVLILHFNGNVNDDKEKTGKGLETILTDLWDPNGNGELKMSTYYKNNGQWPTLRQAIESKQRIFVFMDEEPAGYINPEPDWLVRSNDFIASTYALTVVLSSSTCSEIVSQATSKCDTGTSFIELSAFATIGACADTRAKICSRDAAIGAAMDECYAKRERYGRVVNFLSVDYAVDSIGYDTLSVVDRARTMNEKNIQKFNP